MAGDAVLNTHPPVSRPEEQARQGAGRLARVPAGSLQTHGLKLEDACSLGRARPPATQQLLAKADPLLPPEAPS